MKSLISKLDELAGSLESKGLRYLAKKVDSVTNGLTQPLSSRRDYGTKSAAVEEEREIRLRLGSLPESVIDSPECVSYLISQAFIAVGQDDTDVRIRKESKIVDGVAYGTCYTMTAKNRPKYQEAETEITKEIFDGLWKNCTKKEMVKVRYKYRGWDIDEILEGDSKGQIWAEFEYDKNVRSIEVPSDWDVKEKRV